MSGNIFGEMFRISTFGESHGEALGVVIDGCPAGINLSVQDIMYELDRRKPGQSDLTTSRSEDDKAEILSGVFEGKTTGTPIAIMVRNTSQRSKDYDAVKNVFRPGHADFTYHKKYGVRDYRGGGRASARETIGRVAGGAVAKKILDEKGIDVFAYVIQVGNVKATDFDKSFIENNAMRTASREMADAMEQEVRSAKAVGDSIGAVVELVIKNVPIGLGEPVFDRLNARLAYAIMGIPAVKGVEFGKGFEAATMRGSEMHDEMTKEGFLSNNAGGTLGGISNGEDIVLRFALKPTPSITIPKRSIDVDGNEIEVITNGRHDPCVAPRAVPIAEAMARLVVADMLLIDFCRTSH